MPPSHSHCPHRPHHLIVLIVIFPVNIALEVIEIFFEHDELLSQIPDGRQGFAVPLVHWKVRPLNAAHACTAAYTLVDPDAATVEHDSMDKSEVLEQALPAKPESGTASNPKRK